MRPKASFGFGACFRYKPPKRRIGREGAFTEREFQFSVLRDPGADRVHYPEVAFALASGPLIDILNRPADARSVSV